MDERKRHALPPYREIADGSLSLRAPIGGGRYVDRPEAVRFLPGAAHFFRLKSIATTLEPSSGGDAGGSPSFSAVSLSSRSSSASCTWNWSAKLTAGSTKDVTEIGRAHV